MFQRKLTEKCFAEILPAMTPIGDENYLKLISPANRINNLASNREDLGSASPKGDQRFTAAPGTGELPFLRRELNEMRDERA